MYDFAFPAYGTHCSICEEQITTEQYRRAKMCDECEFDSLTPEAWPELLLAAIEHWKHNTAT